MQTHYYDKERNRRYDLYAMCPKCRGEVYWRSYNTIITSENEEPIKEEIVAHCENSNLAYRSFNIKEGKKMCDWRGKVNRSDDGNLVITNFDGSPVPHRVYISENYSIGYRKGIDYIIDFVV